jgi:alkylation response protein AidB-like acyl-CoA dehydrogenase
MMMVGEMQERMDRCIENAKERQAFGRSIGSNQCVAGKIVDRYGLEKGLRNAIGAPIYSGTNETQRVRIASMLGL